MATTSSCPADEKAESTDSVTTSFDIQYMSNMASTTHPNTNGTCTISSDAVRAGRGAAMVLLVALKCGGVPLTIAVKLGVCRCTAKGMTALQIHLVVLHMLLNKVRITDELPGKFWPKLRSVGISFLPVA